MSTTTRPRTRAQSRLPRSQSQHQASIQRFTKSSKPASSTLPPSKSLLLLDGDKETGNNNASPCASPSSRLTASPSKKRKLNEITTPTAATSNTLDNQTIVTTTGSTRPSTDRDPSIEDTPSKTLKFSDLSVSTPRSCRTKRTATATVTATRSKSTRVRSTKSSKITKSLSLPNISESLSSTEYPAALVDFLNLHSCFLKALSLHFAHNEYSSSADLRELLPGIAKIWKKRKVLITDLQRIVHVWDEADKADDDDDDDKKKDSTSNPRFRIANYGLNKVCLERLDHSGSGSHAIFDENEIHESFTTIMHNKWQDQVNQLCQSEEKNIANLNKPDLMTFDVDKLPLAPIQDCLTPFNMFRKGQQRLQDLKGGVVKVKTAVLKAASLTSTSASNIMPVTRDPAADRRRGLFERIKNKELLQSKLGPTLTKEQLLRRSAAQRAEDVARVLALLRPPYLLGTDGRSTVTQKKPFSWQSLIQTVRDSLRNPIPADEIAVCLDLLAQKDIAGDWIEVFTLGDLKSVVLVSTRDVSPKEIGIKVAKMKL